MVASCEPKCDQYEGTRSGGGVRVNPGPFSAETEKVRPAGVWRRKASEASVWSQKPQVSTTHERIAVLP